MQNLTRKKQYPERVLLLAGLSESGKSSAGRFLNDRGFRRIKFVKLLAAEALRNNSTLDPYDYCMQLDIDEDSKAKIFVQELLRKSQKENIRFCVVESMIRPDTAQAIKNLLGEKRALIVYIDVSEATRLCRQMVREHIDLAKAKKLMLPRDATKKSHGANHIKEIADVIIDNEGSLDSFKNQLSELVRKYLPGDLK